MSSQGNGTASEIRFLPRPDGRIGFEVKGEGPLVICAPGMGDLRFVYRHLARDLVVAGYRVAVMDLRGHGDSDATFHSCDDVAAGQDLLALAHHLGGRAVLIGNSMSAGAAAWAAAEDPDAVAGLVLIGPFVRDPSASPLAVLAFRMALMRPWGLGLWLQYYRRLYPGRRPPDLDEHVARLRESLGRPGRFRAFVATTHTSHGPVEARLAEVTVPSLVVMGTKDPDFPDPTAEAALVADRLHARIVMVTGAGHYPQAEYPEIVSPAVIDFLSRELRHAQG